MKFIKTYESLNQDYLNKELFKYCGSKSSLEYIKKLIKDGADVNYITFDKTTPIIKASKHLLYNIIKVLIENGANVNARNILNETGLIVISQYPNYTLNKNKKTIYKIIDLFIENNIDLNIKATIGRGYTQNYTALDYSDLIKDYIEKKYPDKYKEYISRKTAEKYNI